VQDAGSMALLAAYSESNGLTHGATARAMQPACALFVVICGWLFIERHRHGHSGSRNDAAQ
jgi:hypothetical protein